MVMTTGIEFNDGLETGLSREERERCLEIGTRKRDLRRRLDSRVRVHKGGPKSHERSDLRRAARPVRPMLTRRPNTAQSDENEFGDPSNYLESMARREGVEPPTLRFEA